VDSPEFQDFMTVADEVEASPEFAAIVAKYPALGNVIVLIKSIE
jgi:hypothetical protein